MPEPSSLEDLVRAICDGRPIDWQSVEADDSPGFRDKLAALRVVERVSRAQRSWSVIDTAAAGVVAAGTEVRWGHLQLLEHLASGAFGDVYRAWDPGLDREVALKLLRRADAEAHPEEAVDEGRLLARVRHPNVVTVHGAARLEGKVGLWMELVHGRTLADVVAADGPLPAPRVAAIGRDLCGALGAVHGAGLLHRDVKPQNLMLADDGRVVLMDFGTGRDVRHAAFDMAGTPAYLAPELRAGESATIRSDIYSLGILLAFALTGTYALEAALSASPKASPALTAIIRRATADDPQDRFESTEAIGGALSRVGRSRWGVLAVAVGVTLVVSSLLLILALKRPRDHEVSSRRALETSWQGAIPSRSPFTPDQLRLFSATQGTFSLHGIMTGITDGPTDHESLLTFDPRSGEMRTWLTYSFGSGHPESPVVSPDDSIVSYVWQDVACHCASLRTVDRRGQVRTLLAGPEIVNIWIGATTSRRLPVVVGRKAMQYAMAVVDVDTGGVRVLRTLPVEPVGLSLSPEGRFLAYDRPARVEPGAARNVLIYDVEASQEWPLLDTAGDRTLPVWSPRGDDVLYMEATSDTPVLRAVKVSNGHRASEPALLRRDLGRPGGIGFIDRETFAYWVGTGRNDVMVVDAAADGSFGGQQPRRIGPGGMMPAWSPDGRWLAWSDFTPRTGGMRITRGDGQIVRMFKPSLDVHVYPAWADDSRHLAFWDVGRSSGVLKVGDAETSEVREVLRSTHPQMEGAYSLGWMPGGHEVLMTPDNHRILAVDIETGRQREIHSAAPGNGIDLIFTSHDGRSLAFCEGHGAGRWSIHVLPLTSGGRTTVWPASRIAEGESLMGWWPDGSLLEDRQPLAPPNAQDELWRLPLDGRPAESLGFKSTGIMYTSVAPDARHIAYTSQTFGQELWTLKMVAQ